MENITINFIAIAMQSMVTLFDKDKVSKSFMIQKLLTTNFKYSIAKYQECKLIAFQMGIYM
jgi:hypothetical protein